MLETILSPFVVILSLCTSTGILLHDTKVDKVASLALFSSATSSQYMVEDKISKIETATHTHVERASGELRGHSPAVSPRKDDKKFLLQKKVSRGFHAFDSYNLPLDLADNGQLGF